jgi:hypothetical protein
LRVEHGISTSDKMLSQGRIPDMLAAQAMTQHDHRERLGAGGDRELGEDGERFAIGDGP